MIEDARQVEGAQAQAEDAGGYELVEPPCADHHSQQHGEPHEGEQAHCSVGESVDGLS